MSWTKLCSPTLFTNPSPFRAHNTILCREQIPIVFNASFTPETSQGQTIEGKYALAQCKTLESPLPLDCSTTSIPHVYSHYFTIPFGPGTCVLGPNAQCKADLASLRASFSSSNMSIMLRRICYLQRYKGESVR